MRAAIYARFSSDMQRDRSIEDQQELCRSFAERNGMVVVASFEDRAKSSASVLGRDGLLNLMERSALGDFDVVVVEALDRISRDQEDLASIYKRLTFRGIKIHAVHDGVADQVAVGIRGLVGALFLQDLAHKVHRGLAGVTRDGRHAGGRAYGYRPVPGAAGELEIVPAERDVLQRIYAEFLSGRSPREICAGLNAAKIAPPRGSYWSAGVMTGNRKRGYGILVNPIYAGKIVWNRVHMIKDPETGKRVSRPNPPTAWQTVDAEHLRIIDQETWDAAQKRLTERTALPAAYRRRPKHLLSGLLRCGCCGSGMSVKDTTPGGRVRVHCTAAREGGVCASTKTFYLDDIEALVLSGLKDILSDRRAVSAYIARYNATRQRLASDAFGRRDATKARLRDIGAELSRVIELAVKGLITDAEATALLPALRAEKVVLEQELAATEEATTVIRMHPGTAKAYLGYIDDLGRDLEANDNDPAKLAVRELIERVTVTPTEKKPAVSLEGWLRTFRDGSDEGFRAVANPRYQKTPHDVRIPFSLELRA